MANSEKLQENTKQHAPKNELSKVQDNLIVQSMKKTLKNLQLKYPGLDFGIQTVMKICDLGYDNYDLTTKRTYIQPDGGFLFVYLKGQKYYLLVSEQKTQGTNDKKFLKSPSKLKFKKQSQGNAVERVGKNFLALEFLFRFEDIFPFVVFLQGCDFHEEESTIPDRVRVIFRGLRKNVINLQKIKITETLWAAGSYFMRGHSYRESPGTSDWSFDEIYEINNAIAFETLEYYIQKYGK
jgi:hypothetical protein